MNDILNSRLEEISVDQCSFPRSSAICNAEFSNLPRISNRADIFLNRAGLWRPRRDWEFPQNCPIAPGKPNRADLFVPRPADRGAGSPTCRVKTSGSHGWPRMNTKPTANAKTRKG